MSELPAFKELQNFIGEQTARKPQSKPKQKADTANQLTAKVIKHIRDSGGFAARINTTGLYDEKLRKYRPSGATKGVPDILACVRGRFVGIEVKIGKDRLSPEQMDVARQIESSLGYFIEIRSFDQFCTWYEAKTRPPF